MSKTYRTAKGQLLDVGSLLLQNENTRAVGNMGVNARGDKINSDGAVIKGRNEQMQKQYSQVHKKVQKKTKDQPIFTSAKQAQEAGAVKPKAQAEAPKPQTTKAPSFKADQVEEVIARPNTPTKSKATGLAGAIAKARSVEQTEEKTAKQIQQEKEGVKRI